MVYFSERLRELRKAKGLTQAQVAELVGGTKMMISSYESGTRYPPYATLIKISNLYGVSTDYLLGINKNRTINVDGLSDEQLLLVQQLINALRSQTIK